MTRDEKATRLADVRSAIENAHEVIMRAVPQHKLRKVSCSMLVAARKYARRAIKAAK